MGLYTRAKGLPEEYIYNRSYILFTRYRIAVARAYNETTGDIYNKDMLNKLTDEDRDVYNSLCNGDLDIFLMHSDCDGKFTPQECRKIYNVLKDLKIDDEYLTDVHDMFINIFRHCYNNRVNLYFE